MTQDNFKPPFVASVSGYSASGYLNPPHDPAKRARRAMLMLAIISVHAGLAAWILSTVRTSAEATKSLTIAAIDISSEVPKPEAPARPSAVPPKTGKRTVALFSTNTFEQEAAPAGTGNGEGCSVGSAIGAAISADPEAMEELAALPAGSRTDADAVMLWNGAWLGAAPEPLEQLPQQPVPALKRVVTDAVQALPVDCREVLTTGPQLIPIQEPGRTTMLVIGSGVWRWAMLIDPPVDPATSEPQRQSLGDWLPSFGTSGN